MRDNDNEDAQTYPVIISMQVQMHGSQAEDDKGAGYDEVKKDPPNSDVGSFLRLSQALRIGTNPILST